MFDTEAHHTVERRVMCLRTGLRPTSVLTMKPPKLREVFFHGVTNHFNQLRKHQPRFSFFIVSPKDSCQVFLHL